MSTIISPNLTQNTFNWLAWKALYAVKGSLFQYSDDGTLYTIWSYDGPEVNICQIWKGTVPPNLTGTYSQAQNDSDKADFETNYKPSGNQSLYQSDTDGAQIVRNKAAKKGWTYCAAGIEFSTSSLGSLISNLFDGTARAGITLSFYDGSGAQITSSALMSGCVQTVIDFEPPYDYEIIGGALRHNPTINTDVRLWIIAVPDIPAPNGTKEMAANINLKYLSPGNELAIDGRVSKYLTYSSTYHTNKLRFIFKHSAGDVQNIHIVVEHYRA